MSEHVVTPPRARTGALVGSRLRSATFWLPVLVAVATVVRVATALPRDVPRYLPDEYLYPLLARSFAAGEGIAILGEPTAFPALLEPLLAAPLWATTTTAAQAVALTQLLHALLVSLAAVPVFVLARRLGLAERTALLCAALTLLAPAGFYAALRLGFFSPEEELNAFDPRWIDHYTVNGLALHDPLMRWIYSGSGARRWSELAIPDPMGVLSNYAAFGMRYGAVICVTADEDRPRRTFGYFARHDRELSQFEIRELEAALRAAHFHEPETDQALTRAQTDALRLLSRGMRLKEIAHALGISESAVKARLKSAMARMDARTPVQAASIASQRGLLK
jgi:aldose 1-epimerase/LuxR family transcriptional regulator